MQLDDVARLARGFAAVPEALAGADVEPVDV